jgi:hypothetical protein
LPALQNEVMKVALEGTGRVSLMASEEDDEPVSVHSACGREGGSYVAVFDPLDGSRNIDASIPTGTIFGLYAAATSATQSSMQNLIVKPPAEEFTNVACRICQHVLHWLAEICLLSQFCSAHQMLFCCRAGSIQMRILYFNFSATTQPGLQTSLEEAALDVHA